MLVNQTKVAFREDHVILLVGPQTFPNSNKALKLVFKKEIYDFHFADLAEVKFFQKNFGKLHICVLFELGKVSGPTNEMEQFPLNPTLE